MLHTSSQQCWTKNITFLFYETKKKPYFLFMSFALWLHYVKRQFNSAERRKMYIKPFEQDSFFILKRKNFKPWGVISSRCYEITKQKRTFAEAINIVFKWHFERHNNKKNLNAKVLHCPTNIINPKESENVFKCLRFWIFISKS